MSDDPPETFLLTTPEQLKAISDPFRQRLVGAFVQPATARQAAERLGVPVGRLYHHLDQLEAAGLLTIVAERRRRGAIERTFQAAGRRLAVAPDALGVGDRAQARERGRETMARRVLDEMLAAIPSDGSPELRIARTRLRLTPEALAWFESRFAELLRELDSPDGLETDLLFFAAPRS